MRADSFSHVMSRVLTDERRERTDLTTNALVAAVDALSDAASRGN